MQPRLSTLRTGSCLVLGHGLTLVFALTLGCGDSVIASDDEAGDDSTSSAEGSGSSSSGNVEAGSEANDSSDGASGSGESSSSGSTDTTASTGMTDDPLDTTDTTGEPPPNCVDFDEPTCQGIESCVPYVGQPYTMTMAGMICLGEPQFLGCLFALDACLPATGTLCMGDQAYAVDNLCPPPEGYAACDPPVVFAEPCVP